MAMPKHPTIDEGISQSLRNQRHDEIPLLFAYSQMLLSINGNEGRYGTCGTPAKFWAAWREEDITMPRCTPSKTKRSKMNSWQAYSATARQRPGLVPEPDRCGELAVTGQDQLLISLLSPARLLEMTATSPCSIKGWQDRRPLSAGIWYQATG